LSVETRGTAAPKAPEDFTDESTLLERGADEKIRPTVKEHAHVNPDRAETDPDETSSISRSRHQPYAPALGKETQHDGLPATRTKSSKVRRKVLEPYHHDGGTRRNASIVSPVSGHEP